MSSHPDADAFIRAILHDPADATLRLVFADWLEETGTLPNRAWAYYLRLWVEAERLAVGSRQRQLLELEAATHVPYITAQPAVPPDVLIRHHRSLVALLPVSHFTAMLADFEIPRNAVELVPESVARENFVLPLDLKGQLLVVATADPQDYDTVQKLNFILNRDIVAVRGEPDDILAAINRHYGQSETESVDSVQYIIPIEFDIRPGAKAGYGDEPNWVVQLVNSILRDARSRGAERVMVSPLGGVTMWSVAGGELPAPAPLPGHAIRPVAWRVARMVDDRYMLEHSGRATGRFICRLGPDGFLVRGVVEVRAEGPTIQLDLAADDTLDFP
jgi:uncharacterized protein (TIGR02996 family)